MCCGYPLFSFLRACLLAGVLMLPCGAAQGQTRILFVGNSFTHGHYNPVLNYNAAGVTDENSGVPPGSPRHQGDPSQPGPWGGVPGIFKQFTQQAGLNYEVHLEAISGASLETHFAYALPVIRQARWDRVVLQELSTRPLPAARGGQPSAFVDYTSRLEQAVHAVNPAAKLYLYQTWARADMTYPAGQPYSGLSIEAMGNDLHDGYALAQSGRFAAIAPVGDAWLRAIRAGVALRNPYNPTPGLLNLWGTDAYHPSKWGAYLNACVLFGQITATDPRTLGGGELAAAALGIAPAEAVALQRIAFEQVRVQGGALPVTLISFTAERQATGVAVRWATATEKNNERFEVQRSEDGSTFATVASVAGHGDASQREDYSVFDAQAPLTPLYYRLRQVDIGGQATFSPVVMVAGAAAVVSLYPNPAHELVTLTGPGTTFSIRNSLGQVVLQGIADGGGQTTIRLETLPAGVYQVGLQTSSGLTTGKLIKQ